MIPAEHTPDACPACAAGHPCRIARGRPAAYWRNYRADPGVWGPILLRDARADRDAPGPMPALAPPTDASDAPTIDADAFLTTDRLLADTHTLIRSLPPDIDMVAAIARSGLLPGSLVAFDLHVPLLTVSRQAGVLDPGHGGRLENRAKAEPRHILLIDDTAAHGREMAACMPLVKARYPDARITRAVVYCHPQAVGAVDRFVYLYPGQHLLSWNWQNAGHGAACGYDFDGILCRDFTVEECRTEASYRAAMETITPLYLPRRVPVKLIVTGRPESCRDITLAWLARHGVAVERLVMWPGDPHPRAEDVAPWKARHYRESPSVLFAESDPIQAEIIARESGKPVLCPAAGRLIRPPRAETPRRQIDRSKPRMRLGEAQKPRAGCVSCAEKAKAMEAAR